MGYYTSFTVSAVQIDSNSTKIDNPELFDEIKSKLEAISGYSFEGNLDDELYMWESVKWYECEEDMNQISLLYPDILFVVHGEGEESGDLWNHYHLNGQIQRDVAEIKYEGFSRHKLQPYKKERVSW